MFFKINLRKRLCNRQILKQPHLIFHSLDFGWFVSLESTDNDGDVVTLDNTIISFATGLFDIFATSITAIKTSE